MCLSPKTIVNPSKYVRIRSNDRFLIQVPCGCCSECQSLKVSEWSYRLLYQAIDTFENNGFVMMSTLTYSPDCLPHFSDFVSIDGLDLSQSCFNPSHLRLFVARLRQVLKRQYNSNFTYFIVSEYGASESYLYNGRLRKSTHRPHYHVLFFVTGDISFVDFSRCVDFSWVYGRTDGITYSGFCHVQNHVFNTLDGHTLRSIRYVCKYIQKDSEYSIIVKSSVDRILDYVSYKFNYVEGWKESSHYWRLRDKYTRYLSQFHRQSTNLGVLALRDIDINSIISNPVVSFPDPSSVVQTIQLPRYYIRKMFYNCVCVDGSFVWIPNELGEMYLSNKLESSYERLRNRFKEFSLTYHYSFDIDKLAYYCIYQRGRFVGSYLSPSIKYSSSDYYVYVNRYDKENFGKSFISPVFLGNSSCGYYSHIYRDGFSVNKFIRKYVYLDPDLEEHLQYMADLLVDNNNGIQAFDDYKIHLFNLLHFLKV